MLAFVRRKGSADTVSTSPSSSTDGGDDLLSALQPPPNAPPQPPAAKKKRPLALALLQRGSRDSTASTKDSGSDLVIPGASAEKDAAASASLASHVVWKLAMRMSLHNESRILQHLSRSMLSMGSPHKVGRG